MQNFIVIIIVFLLLAGCVSKSEKAKNTIPYKYRTAEHVKIACDNQMKRNSNSKAKSYPNDFRDNRIRFIIITRIKR